MILDRVMETSTSTGTGTFTLAGAVAGYEAFPDGTYVYCIEAVDENGNPSGAFEIGVGTVASSVLTRTTVQQSSNSDAAVNFGVGSKRVFITASAAYLEGLKAETFTVAVSDETSDLTTGTAKLTFRMPFAMTLTAVRASVGTAPTGSVLTVDINEAGSTILSTKLTIDAGEKTSTTAATAAVISDSALADDAEMTIDIDTVGSTIAGAGLKVTFIGTRA